MTGELVYCYNPETLEFTGTMIVRNVAPEYCTDIPTPTESLPEELVYMFTGDGWCVASRTLPV